MDTIISWIITVPKGTILLIAYIAKAKKVETENEKLNATVKKQDATIKKLTTTIKTQDATIAELSSSIAALKAALEANGIQIDK